MLESSKIGFMPNQIFELFGRSLQDESAEAMMLRHEAKCPFSNGNCDGGGNRHQTTISLRAESKELQAFFPNLEQEQRVKIGKPV